MITAFDSSIMVKLSQLLYNHRIPGWKGAQESSDGNILRSKDTRELPPCSKPAAGTRQSKVIHAAVSGRFFLSNLCDLPNKFLD